MPASTSNPRDTPAMRQYMRFKQRHPGCVLMFRIGDFYEMFDDDAVLVSKAIGLTLTQRTAGVPMCGVPFHQLETYLRRMINAGMRVAVCDQVQDASEVKGGAIIERAVTRVLTPGTLVDESLLAEDEANVLAAVWVDAPAPGALAHLAITELSTGAFTVLSCPPDQLDGELARRRVRELLWPEADQPPAWAIKARNLGVALSAAPGWHFRLAEAGEALREQFGVQTLAGFGLGDDDPLVAPAGAIVRYLRTTQALDDADAKSAQARLAHLRPPRREDSSGTLVLDAASMRALEIDRTLRGGAASGSSSGAEGSLLGIFLSAKAGTGQCRTPMGKRLIREWLVRPLADLPAINARHSAVGALVEDRRLAGELGDALAGVQDIARIGGRVALKRCTPRDLVALASSLSRVGLLAELTRGTPALKHWHAALDGLGGALAPIADEIQRLCVEAPPHHLREGGLIRDGVDAELDEARQLATDSTTWLAQYQARLVAEHQLPSLKVGYNKIFGYYIELPKAQAARAPAEFSRRQTLTGAERYITPELKEFEDKVTTARSRALAREQALFDGLIALAAGALDPITRFADAASQVDVLLALADKAHTRRWVKPEMTLEPVLRIEQGRHPVLDELLEGTFVPNDVALGGDQATLALITGPNMAGKSTFIRQVALITLLAHAGGFVPADKAHIGLTDRIFTRIGADDALHAGQSTFMVEMVETAGILHHAGPRSLVVLDEIGRGTSTLDGLSLAWAIAENLAGAAEPAKPAAKKARPPAATGPGPRTLFATHYHELTRLQEQFPGRVTNLQVAVREWGEQIVFLHRIIAGRADRSYGLHVAKLAGLPAGVVARAREVLDSLSVEHAADARAERAASSRRPADDSQMGLFTQYLSHPAVDRLREMKIESLTPLQAFDELRALKDEAGRTDDQAR